MGDPSLWPNQNCCLLSTKQIMLQLIEEGKMKEIDSEATAMNAALWIAAIPYPDSALPSTVAACSTILSGFRI